MTLSDEAAAQEFEGFGDWIVGSSWLRTVGADYSVVAASHLAKVRLKDASSAVEPIGSDVGSLLSARIADGTLPGPDLGEVLYVVYVTSLHGGQAWHSVGFSGNEPFAYALVAHDVVPQVEWTQCSASHEIIEAVTDPFLSAYGITDPSNPWSARGGEVGDLCESLDSVDIEGFKVTRVWSNSAAASGGDPCVPSAPGPFYAVSTISTNTTRTLSAGCATDIDVVGWSTAVAPPWMLSTPYRPDPGVAFTVNGAPFGDTDQTFDNGASARITVSVGSDATPGARFAISLISGEYDGGWFSTRSEWPLEFAVGQASDGGCE